MTASTSSSERSLCLRCLRSQAVCFCAEIEPIATSFDTILLQHPRERRNTIGTARLTHLSLSNSRIFAGVRFDQDPRVLEILEDSSRHCVLLYPGPHSVDLEADSSARAFPSDRQLTVFVIDGTWHHAKSMMNQNSRLRTLPQVRFNPREPSNYRVRRQPNPHCLSTIEAVHRLIGLLDPQAQADSLLRSFERLVELQVACALNPRLRENSPSRKTQAAV